MMREVTIRNYRQVENLVFRASSLLSDVGVHDANGTIADAKSLLGLMDLDISKPVHLVSEDERALSICAKAFRS